MRKKMLFLILIIHNIAFSACYDTLPKGVNTLVVKQVLTNTIQSKYDSSESNKSLLLSENFNTSRIIGISDTFKSYFTELNQLSPEAFNHFTLGEFKAQANAKVNAQAFGLGYGITDRLTIYGALPIYHMKTNISIVQTSPSNISDIQKIIANTNPTTISGDFVKQLTLQLPETNGPLIQSVLVNFYHYRPIGTWEKDSIGDFEFGAIYRFTDIGDKGMSLTIGGIIPTGTKDDPNSLQDISTSDGVYSSFLELNSGINFFDNTFKIDLTNKFSYQFKSTKTLRTYTDPNLPLSDTTTDLEEKLGNKTENTLAFTYSPTYWLDITTSYIHTKVGQTNYNGQIDQETKKAMEDNTNSLEQWTKLSIGISTIEMYKRKIFEVPFEIVLSGQKLLNAKNTADYKRFDLDLKLFF
jgi:hypothetical protein